MARWLWLILNKFWRNISSNKNKSIIFYVKMWQYLQIFYILNIENIFRIFYVHPFHKIIVDLGWFDLIRYGRLICWRIKNKRNFSGLLGVKNDFNLYIYLFLYLFLYLLISFIYFIYFILFIYFYSLFFCINILIS